MAQTLRKAEILIEAAILVDEYQFATIDDLIVRCEGIADEDEVFEAVSNSQFSTLYDATGF